MQDKISKYRYIIDPLKTVEDFKYLGTILTYQNFIHEEIKNRLKSGNACYHSVQNPLSSNLLSENVKIYRTIILLAVLYGCETWSPTLREKCTLSVFEKRVLRRIFGLKSDEITGEWRRLHNEELYALYSSSDIIRVFTSRGLTQTGREARMGRGQMHTRFW
jgi:hypothetical protein